MLEGIKKMMMQKDSGSLCGQQRSWTNSVEVWEKTERSQILAVVDNREGKGRRKGRSPERDYWIPPLPVFWFFSARLINIVQVINSDLQTGKWQLLLVFVTSVGFRIGISGK